MNERTSSTLPTTRRRRPLWDGLTIGLAIAIVLLGALIVFMPHRASSPSSHAAPESRVPADMASLLEVTSAANHA